MERAIILRTPGGPDVLEAEPITLAAPGEGQVLLRHTAIGVNFHDCYVRSGLYQTLPLPGVPGLEGVGVVEAMGPGVAGFGAGDRVVYMTREYGGYSTARLIAASHLLKVPDGLDDRAVASSFLRGLTAHALVRQVTAIRPGQTVLVHAAAGGVGRLLCQWASHLGATVIGTVGSEEKAAAARENGCAHTILYRTENFVDRVRDITGGRGVDVAYDPVGKDTFEGSLKALAMRGHLVNFGQASGPIEPFRIALLFEKSNTITRPNVFHYFTGAEREVMVKALFEALVTGVLTAGHRHEYPLDEAARAHADMEARRTSGAVLLIP